MVLYVMASLGMPIAILVLWALAAGANRDRLAQKSAYAVAVGVCGSLLVLGIAALIIIWSGREQGGQYDPRPVMYSYVVVGNSVAGIATVGFLWLIRPGQRQSPKRWSHSPPD
jgi:nitrogen fixation-related uncharacterized protein